MQESEPSWLLLAGLPVAGALATHLWSRYRGRMVRLMWSADHTPMAFASNDVGFGEITVLYNGQPTVNLHVTRVLLTNDSSKDLTNVTIRFAFLEGTRILHSHGFRPGTLETFPASANFTTHMEAAVAAQPQPEAINYILRNHEYTVPVLNRQQVAQFGLLVTRDDHNQPTVHVEVTHPGTRLDYRQAGDEVFGTRRVHAQVVGVLASIAILVVLLISELPRAAGIAFAWIAGAYALLLGALTVRTFRALGRMLS